MPASVQIANDDVHNHPGISAIPDEDVHNHPVQSTGGVTLDDAGESAIESNVSPSDQELEQMPEAIRAQADQTKYYRPEDNDPNIGEYKRAGAIAYQDQNDPNAVAVINPEISNAGVKAHEAYHAMIANMPPTEAAKVPADEGGYGSGSKIYDVTDAAKWRSQGKTITDIPQEKAARIVEHYTNGDAATKKQLQPWIDDLKNVKQSVVLPTRPGQVDIETSPRAPKGGQQMLEDLPTQSAPKGAVKKASWSAAASRLGRK